MDTRIILMIGAPCDGNCAFLNSVRKAGAQVLVALSAENAVELLSSQRIDGVLIHQDNVGFGNMIAAEVQAHWPEKPQGMVCQDCVKQPLVPFGAEAFTGFKPLGEQQKAGSYLLYSSEGLLAEIEGAVERAN